MEVNLGRKSNAPSWDVSGCLKLQGGRSQNQSMAWVMQLEANTLFYVNKISTIPTSDVLYS